MSGSFGRAKIPMARPNEPDMPPKRTKKKKKNSETVTPELDNSQGTVRYVAVMADTVKVDITAITTDAADLTTNEAAVTMHTVLRGGTVITARVYARWANAGAAIRTTAHVMRCAWMASAGKGNAIITTNQTHGRCRELKKPNEFCPMKPDGYHCGCTEGYECKRYQNNYYWGQCKKKPPPPCSSDDSCQKTHCCSGGKCKPRKKAKEFCPHKGADIYNCGCIEGYFCKQYGDSSYWGTCEKVVPPTEEPGSGVGE
ncbi:hypothetical protein ACROYT_G034016 [Oculina patagonica]